MGPGHHLDIDIMPISSYRHHEEVSVTLTQVPNLWRRDRFLGSEYGVHADSMHASTYRVRAFKYRFHAFEYRVHTFQYKVPLKYEIPYRA